ncbi:hypothetical protein GCM10017600_65440 [Streptosporangium carneum]|uniref:Uncharacterized protein n=1 Tax=Streptosporangium carneum TaxID=47481 RepID=A0A9W6I8G8_9ACTN|nr:hypothetical protein GCM10017600_65440 [Streptosporangium carneum]
MTGGVLVPPLISSACAGKRPLQGMMITWWPSPGCGVVPLPDERGSAPGITPGALMGDSGNDEQPHKGIYLKMDIQGRMKKAEMPRSVDTGPESACVSPAGRFGEG